MGDKSSGSSSSGGGSGGSQRPRLRSTAKNKSKTTAAQRVAAGQGSISDIRAVSRETGQNFFQVNAQNNRAREATRGQVRRTEPTPRGERTTSTFGALRNAFTNPRGIASYNDRFAQERGHADYGSYQAARGLDRQGRSLTPQEDGAGDIARQSRVTQGHGAQVRGRGPDLDPYSRTVTQFARPHGYNRNYGEGGRSPVGYGSPYQVQTQGHGYGFGGSPYGGGFGGGNPFFGAMTRAISRGFGGGGFGSPFGGGFGGGYFLPQRPQYNTAFGGINDLVNQRLGQAQPDFGALFAAQQRPRPISFGGGGGGRRRQPARRMANSAAYASPGRSVFGSSLGRAIPRMSAFAGLI